MSGAIRAHFILSSNQPENLTWFLISSLIFCSVNQSSRNSNPIKLAVISTTAELEAAFKIRRLVFVDEQGFELADEYDADDAKAVHILASVAGIPIGTARIIPDQNQVKVGRVAVLQEFRGRGFGLVIMQKCEKIAKERGFTQVTLHAQIQVQAFYENAGYTVQGEIFDECGWPHITMTKAL